jgi:hypothetical protein
MATPSWKCTSSVSCSTVPALETILAQKDGLHDGILVCEYQCFFMCFFCVFSHVEIQTANHFLSLKFWLLWFFKERNLIKRRHMFWSSIREMGTMPDRICQISLISGEIEGHCPLKFGDG